MSDIQTITVFAPPLVEKSVLLPPSYADLVSTVRDASLAFVDEHEVYLDDIRIRIDYSDRFDELAFHDGKLRLINPSNELVPFVVIDEHANTFSSFEKSIAHGFYHHSDVMIHVHERCGVIFDSIDILLSAVCGFADSTEDAFETLRDNLSASLDLIGSTDVVINYVAVDPERETNILADNKYEQFYTVVPFLVSAQNEERTVTQSLREVSKIISENESEVNKDQDREFTLVYVDHCKIEDGTLYTHEHLISIDDIGVHRVILDEPHPFVLIDGYKPSPDLVGWSDSSTLKPGIYLNSAQLFSYKDELENNDKAIFLAAKILNAMENHDRDFMANLDDDVAEFLYNHVEMRSEYVQDILDSMGIR